MTTTCDVCGAVTEADRDRTCPVCGADLPEVDEPTAPDAAAPDATAADAPTDPATEPVASDPPQDTPAGAPSWPVSPPPPTSAGGAPPPPAGEWPAPRPTPPAPRAGYDPSHPSGIPADLRTYATLTHLSTFLGALVALAFTGPLVMWLIRRDEHPFVDHHGKEALNFNLSMLLYGVIAFVGSIITLGIGLVVVVPAAIVFFVVWVVCTILAAVKANRGEGYRYPLTIRFVKD